MTPEQAQIYLSRIQSLLVEMPVFNGSERFPDFHNLVCEAFDNLVAVENYLKRQLVNHDSTGLALSPAQPADAVGQGATACDLGSYRRRSINRCSFCGGSGRCPNCSDVDLPDFGEFHCSSCRDTGECPNCQD